jgi:hypothetical protein
MIEVKKYDESQRKYLEAFIEDLKQYGFEHFNWSSIERMKTDKITYFLAYYKNKIVSMNGCYRWRDDDWMFFSRLLTHPKYFNLLRVKRSMIETRNVWAKSIPSRFLAWPTMMHCLDNGAKNLYFSLNVSTDYKDSNDWRKGISPLRHAHLLEKINFAYYDGTYKVNGVLSDVYILDIEIAKKTIQAAMAAPLEINYEID